VAGFNQQQQIISLQLRKLPISAARRLPKCRSRTRKALPQGLARSHRAGRPGKHADTHLSGDVKLLNNVTTSSVHQYNSGLYRFVEDVPPRVSIETGILPSTLMPRCIPVGIAHWAPAAFCSTRPPEISVTTSYALRGLTPGYARVTPPAAI